MFLVLSISLKVGANDVLCSYILLSKIMGGDCDAMILAAVQATFWPNRVFGVCPLHLFVLTRFTCGNRGEIPCVLILTCAVAVVTEWLISHHCLWLRSEDLFLAIKIHVVF